MDHWLLTLRKNLSSLPFFFSWSLGIRWPGMEVEGHEDKFFTHPLQLVREQMAGGAIGWGQEEGQVLYHSSSVFLNKIGRSQECLNKKEKLSWGWEGTFEKGQWFRAKDLLENSNRKLLKGFGYYYNPCQLPWFIFFISLEDHLLPKICLPPDAFLRHEQCQICLLFERWSCQSFIFPLQSLP